MCWPRQGKGESGRPGEFASGDRAYSRSSRCTPSLSACWCIAGPVHSRTWPALLCRRPCAVSQGRIGPLQPACNSCYALPHCLGAVGSGTPAIHCLTAWGQWAVELLQRTASLPWGSGQWNSCHTLPHCPGGSGQWNSCNAPPHCLGAAGSGTPAMHCPTAWGQWAVQLLQYSAALPGGSGQSNPCIAMHTSMGGRGVQPRGWSEYSSGPMGRRHRRRVGHTGPGGTGSPAQGVVGLSEGRREGRLDRVTGLFQGWRGRGWEGGHPAPRCAVLCCVVLRCVVGCAAMCCVLCCASAERAQVGLWAFFF